MGLITKLAHRFVFDRKLDTDRPVQGFVSFITSISIAGLTIGVTTLLVTTSVINGFERELRRSLTEFHGHILLFSQAEPVEKPIEFAEQLKENFPDIVAVSPYFFIEAMLSSANGVAGTTIEGVHGPTLNEVSKVESKVTEGRMPMNGSEIVLAYEVARKLRIKLDEEIMMTIPFANARSENEASQNASPIVEKLKVVGIVKLGKYDIDNKYSLMDISQVQRIINKPNRANAFKVITKDANLSYSVTAQLNDRFVYPLRARDWSTLDISLFKAIQHEKFVITIILASIVLVASFNIISTLLMLVHDKKRQISMLKAMGFDARMTLSVFMLIGSSIAILGVVIGIGLSGVICKTLDVKSIVDIPAEIYGISKLPIEFRWQEWAGLCFMVFGLALLSTLWPSIKVSKELPSEGLRYE